MPKGETIRRVEIPLREDGTATIGVISDTHVPDRARRLDPTVMRIFKEAQVSAVLHAGDVAVRAVLDELGEFGPVIAVRGNRDWLLAKQLPLSIEAQVGDVTIGMTHGHGGWMRYFVDKYHYLRQGYRAERYRTYLRKVFPKARVIIFGHTHRPEYTWEDGALFFNPGAAGYPAFSALGRSVGILTVGPGEKVEGKIVMLQQSRVT
jgi:putative phosphoesterase